MHSITIDTVPGFKYGYSNIDTELIAHILENVYGETYEDLLKKYIWDVAGMPDTRINLTEEQRSRLANGYGETNKLVPHMANSLWGAAGGLKSTVPDMIRYMKFQLDESNPLIRKSHEVIYDNKGMKLAYYCLFIPKNKEYITDITAEPLVCKTGFL
ncbi:class A beta-lactamase-related serine hydrolase [Sinomicrobium pectinilyticum]|uniref:Class A beta-lactamase-related serine hydrolase n=1 Tax=Sinomicrobium pectinilyticum TaxID=1084421 RepID=A0A3N0ETU0_SINP1|nr:serine hydrolase domain-containing protein [Sinomicrobium pectinilyticum]RNL91313.1 class A beta-lactamase-related serine hydrolase [Sinomicrobium pectinilyticum]